MSMRRYEVVFVLAPQLTEEEVKTQVETYSKVAEEKGATVLQVDEWGKRRLAFPVKKNKEGIYVILTLEEENSDAVRELERRFRVSDAIIRFLTVRIDEDLKRADKFDDRRKRRKGHSDEVPPAEAKPARAADSGPTPAAAAEATEDLAEEETAAKTAESAPEEEVETEAAIAEAAGEEPAEAAAGDETPKDAETVEEKQ